MGTGLRVFPPPLLETLKPLGVRRCAAALRHVRAVTATYRMTTRPPPSRPSHYAAGILAPLRAFLDAPHGRALPAATRASLAQVCIPSQHPTHPNGVTRTRCPRRRALAWPRCETLQNTLHTQMGRHCCPACCPAGRITTALAS